MAKASPSAAQRYQRLWEKVARFYGAEGKPAPNYVFSAPLPTEGGMSVRWDTGNPVVNIDPKTARRLSSTGKRKREVRNSTRSDLIHEWAHVYQPHSVVSDPYDREGGASLFQRKVGMKVLGRGAGYAPTPQMAAFKQKYGKRYWRRGQFGSNYGADPTSITHQP